VPGIGARNGLICWQIFRRRARLCRPDRRPFLDSLRRGPHPRSILATANTLRARLFAAALLLPLLAFVTATGGYFQRCKLTGAVVDACCCGDEDQGSTPPGTTVSQADCCERVERRVASSVAELRAPDPAAAEVALVALPAASASIAKPAPVRVTARGSLGPPTSRLRLLAKSTLLI
jgi:hypothetical protein